MNVLFSASFRPGAMTGRRLASVLMAAATIMGCDNAKPSTAVAPAAETVAPAPATATPAPANAIPLTTGISHETGFAYTFLLPFDPSVRTVKVYEDGKELGPADAVHDDIRNKGEGRYSQWPSSNGSTLYFSASDNTDPNSNGKRYELR